MKPPVPSLAALLESFFRHRLVAQMRASSATLAAYRDAFRLLLVFTAKRLRKSPSRLAIEDLDRDGILAFLDHIEKERGNSVRTRNARLAAIRSFFHHVAYCDPGSMGIVQRVLAIPGKRSSRPVVQYLRDQELEALLAAPDRSRPIGRRDHGLLLFLARTGARVSEAVAVNLADLRLDRPSQVLLRGKGEKERLIPLEEDTVAVLRALLDERRPAPSPSTPIFVDSRGNGLTRHGVIHIVTRAAGTASKDQPEIAKRKVSPHTFRHTRAMSLLHNGADLVTIQNWLGHARVDTTHHYLQADVEMKRRALEKCASPGVAETGRYKPPDDLLALLEGLAIM